MEVSPAQTTTDDAPPIEEGEAGGGAVVEEEAKAAEPAAEETAVKADEENEGAKADVDEAKAQVEEAKAQVEEALKELVESKEKEEEEEEKEKKEEEQPELLENIIHDKNLIEDAQTELKQMDLFVCGTCHSACHFVEEFQAHKLEGCAAPSEVAAASQKENRSQIWAFNLWKAKQRRADADAIPWQFYKTWNSLTDALRRPWIEAGNNLQVVHRIGNAKVFPRKESDEAYAKAGKFAKINSYAMAKNGDSNKAYRITTASTRTECTVEKIVSRRFNPRRKTFEYQVKWENCDSSENSWEHPDNLRGCKKMLDAFEEELKRQKAEQKLNGGAATPKGRGRPRLSASTQKPFTPPAQVSVNVSLDASGRPQRASKQKALSQVKSWCGNISDEEGGGGTKRPYEDDDSDDSFEKKIRMEDYSDSDDEAASDKVVRVPRKVGRPSTAAHSVSVISNNGLGGKIPHNVLIPDANGVVRINQKQLPSLSTGVYIMSKTAGIIKLDSNTSKVATSGGQTIVKVAPKIGQTQIKILKKDGTTTTTTSPKILQVSPNQKGIAQKTYKPVITKIKRVEGAQKLSESKLAASKQTKEDLKALMMETGEDSDDGVPELEFPTEIPIAAPESPPGDFVLDPETGKIAGKEYEERPVVISEFPQPTKIETTSLENIVKLAAADITEEDLQGDPMEEHHKVTPLIEPVVKTESILNKALTNSNIIQTKVAPRPKVMQRPMVRQPQQQQQPQRILNHSIGARQQMARSGINATPLGRQHHAQQQQHHLHQHQQNVMRTKPTPPKQKFNITPQTGAMRVGNAGGRPVYSKPSQPSAVYSRVKQPPPHARLGQGAHNVNVYKAPVRKEVHQVQQQAARPKAVISMPSLIGDDDGTGAAQQQVQAGTSAEASAVEGDLSFTLDNENPIFITGDDGTVYQVAGQNEQGQTILITQGSDGQQQCLLVTNDSAAEEAALVGEEEAVQQQQQQQQQQAEFVSAAGAELVEKEEALSVKTEPDVGAGQDQVVAQVVRAEPLSPGGTHKVVVMLPDGNLMVTQVSPEEYASLELD